MESCGKVKERVEIIDAAIERERRGGQCPPGSTIYLFALACGAMVLPTVRTTDGRPYRVDQKLSTVNSQLSTEKCRFPLLFCFSAAIIDDERVWGEVDTMERKARILLITTGGTIVSRQGAEGLEPGGPQELEQTLQNFAAYYEVGLRDIFCLDSSNIRPEEWQAIARAVYEERGKWDGIVITHGTDTMAYSASALTFMLPGIDLPVVFTGSQLPMQHILSDGPDNLRTAFAMAASGVPGVFLAFDRKVMLGCRAVKVRASGFSAFESINAGYVAYVTDRGLTLNKDCLPVVSGPAALRTDISKNVFLLKLTPGLSPEIFDALAGMGYRGVVIEAFGLGGINVLNRGLQGIRRAVEMGISVVVTTQCLYDSANLRVYQVGSRLLDMGVIQGFDMTSEAAMTKLMWALGQKMTPEEIKKLFAKSIAGEITA